MFGTVEVHPAGPIMIGADHFAGDTWKDKIDLAAGIYQDEHGLTPSRRRSSRRSQSSDNIKNQNRGGPNRLQSPEPAIAVAGNGQVG